MDPEGGVFPGLGGQIASFRYRLRTFPHSREDGMLDFGNNLGVLNDEIALWIPIRDSGLSDKDPRFR